MKLKLKDLHPNPFKKHIDDGKLHQDQVDSIKANLDKLGLMDAIPVTKIDGKYHIVSHHHRREALMQMYGPDYEVNVIEHNYNDEMMLRGMVIENLTQRSGDFRQIKENLSVIKKQLEEHPEWLRDIYIYRARSYKMIRNGKEIELKKTQHQSQGVGAGTIYQWLHNINTKEQYKYFDKNKKIDKQIISLRTISQTIQIDEKLADELKEQIEKQHDKSKDEREEGIGHTLAVLLSSFDDKQEQLDLADAIKNSEEGRVRQISSLLSKYKESPEEIKYLIRNQMYDIKDIEKIVNAFSYLGEDNVNGEVLGKVITMDNEKAEKYLESLSKIPLDKVSKVIEMDLSPDEISKFEDLDDDRLDEVLDEIETSEFQQEDLDSIINRTEPISSFEEELEQMDNEEEVIERMKDTFNKIYYYNMTVVNPLRIDLTKSALNMMTKLKKHLEKQISMLETEIKRREKFEGK